MALELFELNKLEEIKRAYDKNAQVLTQCANYLNYTPDSMTKEYMNEITSGCKELEESSYALYLSHIFNDDKEAKELYREYYIKSIKRLSVSDYNNNPYYKNIKIPSAEIGKWTLSSQSYKPYEAFIYRDLIVEGFCEIPQIGFFDEEFSFPTVFESGVEWMAIKPNEIETMKEPIEQSKGNTLVFGLGLGYFAYMISLKNDVERITIIERDNDVIELFEKYIFPQFEHKEKISIIKSDAFEYVRTISKKDSYDFVFVDLWHDVSDGIELYLKMKKEEHNFKEAKVSYWIEKSILTEIKKASFNALYGRIKNGDKQIKYKDVENVISYEFLKNFTKFI